MSIKNDSITREIINIGVPAMFETLVSTLTGIIDSKMVSALGVTAISSVVVTNQPRLFLFTPFFAINTVTASLTARNVGKGDRDAANRILDAVMKLVVVLSFIMSLFAVLFARPVMIVFSNQKDTLDASILYFRIVMGGMLFSTFFMAVNSALRGCGRTKITFTTNIVSCVVNIIFNYLLIEGHFGFPRLEYAGAAIATVLGNAAATLITLFFAFKAELFVNIPYCLRKKYKVTREVLAEIGDMAKNCIADSFTLRLSLLISSGIVARIGSFHMAIYSVGVHLMNVNMALGTGLQTAAVALIGRCFGAGDMEGIKTYKKHIIKLSAVTGVILGALIMGGGRWFCGFFSNDTEFLSTGSASCVVVGVMTLGQTMKFAFSGCLQGVGAMKEVMIASVIAFAWVNLVTMAVLVMVFRFGLWGVLAGSLLTQFTQAASLYVFMRKKKAIF